MEERRIVDESLQDGASIAEIARLHDLNANQLFTWRRQLGFEPAEATDVTTILPVKIEPESWFGKSEQGDVWYEQRRQSVPLNRL